MTILDILFLVALSAASLCLFVCLVYFVGMLRTGKRVKVLKSKRFKNKTKRKKVKRAIQQMSKKKKGQRMKAIVFFVGSLLFVGGGVYSIYFQSTHLFAEDSSKVVQGYYAVQNLEQEFEAASTTDNTEKIGKNIKVLAGQMASSGINKASTRNTKEGQKLLNQYYKSLRELGMNLSSENNDFFKNEKRFEGFQKDLENVKKNQKAVFDYFGVNESAFKEKQK